MTIKCVMFDLGGTLLDFWFEEKSARIYRNLLKEKGYDISLRKIMGVRKKEYFRHIKENYGKTRKLHRHHLVMKRVLKTFGIVVSEKELRRMVHKFKKEMRKNYRIYPGALGVLSALKKKNLKIAVVCNGNTEWLHADLKRFHIRPYVDFAIASEQIGKEKSSLVPFKITLKRLHVKPKECLMVGDRLDEDMLAKKLGMWTCHAAYGVPMPVVGPRMKPDFVIREIRQLPKVIEKLDKK